MRARVKAALLALPLAWLAAMGVYGARSGVHPAALVGYVMVLAGYALLGALSFGGDRLRLVAAVGALSLTMAVAAATFSHLLLVGGGLAFTAACLPNARRA